MNIREIDRKLQKVYREMSETFGGFQKETGLTCISGCGRCCLNPEIETTVLEMIPFALKMYDEGKVDEWLKKIETDEQKICLLFAPHDPHGAGACGSYQERPSVCRMFGAAGILDKHRKTSLSLCKHIKEDRASLAREILQNIPPHAPMITNWMAKITGIHYELSRDRLPINQAIRKALEYVAFLSQYEDIT